MKILIQRMRKGKPVSKCLDVVHHKDELLIKEDEKVDYYKIEEHKADHPEVKREFTLEKPNGDVYCVRFKVRLGTTCSCKGFADNRYCKHQQILDNLCTTGNVEGIRLQNLVA